MSIGNKTNLTDPLMEPSRPKSSFSQAMVVLLCLVIFAAGISLRVIIRSSQQPGAGQNLAKEAATSSAATSAVPKSAASAAGPLDSQGAKRKGSATAIPQIAGKSGAAEIIVRGKLRALEMRKSAQTDVGLRQPRQNGLRQNRLVQSSQAPAPGMNASVAEAKSSNLLSSGTRDTGSPGNVQSVPPIKPSQDGKSLASQTSPDEAVPSTEKTDVLPDKRPAPSTARRTFDVSSNDANSKTSGVRGARLPGGSADQSAQSGIVSTQGWIYESFPTFHRIRRTRNCA